MRDGGKGDKPRPFSVDLEKFSENFDLIFGKKMTTFTTEDRIKAEDSDDQIAMLKEQLHAQNSEIIRLNQYIRELEAKVYGGTTQ
jgi:hypothetical protein